MKKAILIALILAPIFALSQNWQWAIQAGGNATQSFENGYLITDGTNYYLYGTFSGTMFLQTDTVNSLGNSDFFVIKYNANGTELWVKTFGGNNVINQYERMNAVYDSSSNSIYLAGIFYGNMHLDTISLNSNSYARNFIAKMDLNGNFIWGKKAWIKSNWNFIYDDSMPKLSVRSDGLIYLVANIVDTAYFDAYAVIPGGCMAKFSGNGNCISVRHLYDLTQNTQEGVNINFINYDLLFSGYFEQTFAIDTATLISNGSYDMFIARADSNGNIFWIKQYGFGGLDAITQISLDAFNNIYAGAGFSDSIILGNTTFHNITTDILMLKFDQFGNYIWGKQTNVTGSIASANSIISDGDGNCYVVGTFTDSATFGSFNISTTNAYDMFLTRYDSGGTCLGVLHFGQANGAKVVLDNSNNPVVAGMFSNTVTIGNNTFTSLGPADIYLAKCDIITGISEAERFANNQLIIYANPNAGKCTITIPNEFQHEKNLSISIFDSYGKRIQQIPVEMNENKIKLNLQAEPKGIYTVTLSNGIKSYSGKIVFE